MKKLKSRRDFLARMIMTGMAGAVIAAGILTGCGKKEEAAPDAVSGEESTETPAAGESALPEEEAAAEASSGDSLTEKENEEAAEALSGRDAEGGADEAASGDPEEKKEPLPVPEGKYLSELTGEPIDEDLKDQRPIAAMIDNESKALPHCGTAEADVVYEMMNSTANGRITRLMCLFKDWDNIDQIGSIRSVRPTNILLAQEWDAVICHDGGPFYINDYFSRYNQHFSGTFSRVNNGKAREFTEYILPGDLDSNFRRSGLSRKYDSKKQEKSHFRFAEYGLETDMKEMAGDTPLIYATDIKLPFPHNSSELHYNTKTQTYDYYEYGKIHRDAGTKKVLTFDNVILQNADFHQYDKNGYLIYNCIGSGNGFYITRGRLISILWQKDGESGITRFYGPNGKEITVNTGKTYIGLVPSDSWSELGISH